MGHVCCLLPFSFLFQLSKDALSILHEVRYTLMTIVLIQSYWAFGAFSFLLPANCNCIVPFEQIFKTLLNLLPRARKYCGK